MKTTTILAITAFAAVAVIAPWVWVVGCDNFSVTGGSHKVFSYGFPIPIRECGQDIPIRTPPGQTPFRVAGNFAIFFFGGLAVAGLFRHRRGHSL
jgi:hypothetical protein